MAGRWMIGEHAYEGTVFSVGPLKQYGNGQGTLREIVIKAKGSSSLEPDVFIPVTLFGLDAKEAGESKGSPIRATVRLIARQYEWNGEVRWSLQYTGSRVEIDEPQNPGGVPPGADDSHAADVFANNPGDDDIPF